ncbi:SDR family oxidoreductase [Streptomyces sp. 4F14]|uniref:SDR family oxidoreductase n=1 Tax=Streptomyces sp. 4F14 TaxID=3394380 RepID=UPI003A84060A
MRVLVLGSTGVLGTALCSAQRTGTEITGVSRALCDVTDLVQIADMVAAHRPDAVVNAAALPDTRSCEADPQQAWAVNALGARNVALAANTVDALCVQISGNIVFRPSLHARHEWDHPDNPHGVLATAKTAAEGYIRTLAANPVIVRTACLFGNRAGGTPGGLVGRVLRHAADHTPLHMTADTVTDAAYAQDVADAVLDLATVGHPGIYHLVNDGTTTPAELARKVLDLSGLPAAVTTRTSDFEQRLLAHDLTEACGIRLRPLDEALAAYLTPAPEKSPE